MRTHVGNDKSICLEALEDEIDHALTDLAWNALAKLSQADLMAVAHWLAQGLARLQKAREREHV